MMSQVVQSKLNESKTFPNCICWTDNLGGSSSTECHKMLLDGSTDQRISGSTDQRIFKRGSETIKIGILIG